MVMQVEIWSDVICPWCGLGQHRLEQALDGFEPRDQVRVTHRSFELDPHFSGPVIPVRQMLAKKYGLDDAGLDAMFRRVEGLAASEGLSPYIVGDNVVGNTRLAHELLAMAAERGLEAAAWKRLYRAYFGERHSIFDVDALTSLGAELGLEPEDVRQAFEEERYRARVEADAREATALGATGVPFVVIHRRYAIAGAQPVTAFRQALEKAWGDGAHR